METYCVSCKKNTANKNSSVRKTKENRLMILSNCPIYGKKNRLSSKIKNSRILIFHKKIRLGVKANEQLAKELHKELKI